MFKLRPITLGLLILFATISPGFAADNANRTLIGNRAVQRDLKLSEDQQARIEAILAEIEAEIASKEKSAGDKPDKDAIQTEVLARHQSRLQSILDKDQTNRLWQIGAQVSGPGVFHNPRVLRTLKLTSEQQEKLAELSDKLVKMVSKIAVDPKLNLTVIEQKVELAQRLCLQASISVLTDEQRKDFDTLVGKPFDLELLKRSDGVKPKPLTFVFGLSGQNAFVLINSPAVRKELALSESQSKQVQGLLKKVDEDLTKARLSVLKGAKEFPEMTVEEQQDAVKVILDSAAITHREATGQIAKVLTAEQRVTLDKSLVQKIGARAIESDSIATRLELTEDQKTAFANLAAEFEPATASLRVVRDQTKFDYRSFEKQLAELEAAARMLLTPEQRKMLGEMEAKASSAK